MKPKCCATCPLVSAVSVVYSVYYTLNIATKRAGKTRLMELLSFVAARARHVADITPAALFSMVENEKPALMIDEVERFATSQKDFRAIINSGYRRGGIVTRRLGKPGIHRLGFSAVADPVGILSGVWSPARQIFGNHRGHPCLTGIQPCMTCLNRGGRENAKGLRVHWWGGGNT